jgi:hypothetical protein
MTFNKLEKKDMPEALPLKKLLGPSFILLGLGLGSGEIILWPSLTSNYGMGIIWGALVGITLQFFLNMEIERYTLARGESVFVGWARKFKGIPYWFIFSTFIPWIWPGIAAASATFIGHMFGISEIKYLAIMFIITMGLILSLGRVLYKTVESFQKIIIAIGVPSVFILSIILAKGADWQAAINGVFGFGGDYWLLPEGMPMAAFLAALAYAGAGGNLNLAQSFYAKDKGYGMGKYMGRITSLFTDKQEKVSLTGFKFETNKSNLKQFNLWWKNVNIEHFLVFWFTGAITIVLLGLLAYSTTFGTGYDVSGVNFVIAEAQAISRVLFPVAGTFFLLVTGITLFGTQLTIYDATSRILAENLILAEHDHIKEKDLPSVYYVFLWLQIIAGVIVFLFGLTEPLQLLILAAVLNAFAMFVHSGLIFWLNMTSLDEKIKPSGTRMLAMVCAFLFYGGFSIYVIIDKLIK